MYRCNCKYYLMDSIDKTIQFLVQQQNVLLLSIQDAEHSKTVYTTIEDLLNVLENVALADINPEHCCYGACSVPKGKIFKFNYRDTICYHHGDVWELKHSIAYIMTRFSEIRSNIEIYEDSVGEIYSEWKIVVETIRSLMRIELSIIPYPHRIMDEIIRT